MSVMTGSIPRMYARIIHSRPCSNQWCPLNWTGTKI